METMPIFFIHPRSSNRVHFLLGFPKTLSVNATYEEIINMLIQKGYLTPHIFWPDYYLVYFVAYKRLRVANTVELTSGHRFVVGDTLASIHLIATDTDFLVCLSNTETDFFEWISNMLSRKVHPGPFAPIVAYIAMDAIDTFVHKHNIAQVMDREVAASQPKKKPSSISPSLAETISTVATVGLTILTVTASIATIIQTLIVIQEHWEKTHHIGSAGSPQPFPQPGKTDIYAIRLRMTDGRERTVQKWLTEPNELKHFIDVFLQPSSQVKPTEVVFVLWNRDTIVVDVREGAQGNLQLDEMLKYLKIDTAEK